MTQSLSSKTAAAHPSARTPALGTSTPRSPAPAHTPSNSPTSNTKANNNPNTVSALESSSSNPTTSPAQASTNPKSKCIPKSVASWHGIWAAHWTSRRHPAQARMRIRITAHLKIKIPPGHCPSPLGSICIKTTVSALGSMRWIGITRALSLRHPVTSSEATSESLYPRHSRQDQVPITRT